MPKTNRSDRLQLLRYKADQCVKCGLCLPHCPIYRLTKHEADSPRGRIALIEAIANDKLKLSPSLHQHLNRCLSCKACEAACPAKVEYGEIIDLARIELHENYQVSRIARLAGKTASAILTGPQRRIRQFGRFVRLYQGSWIRKLLKSSGILGAIGMTRLESVVPEQTLPPLNPPSSTHQPTLHLFRGCTGELFDTATLNAAIKLLEALGESIGIPEKQSCCGAISLHGGDQASTLKTMQNNLAVFSNDNLPIVYIATGCGAVLEEYKTAFKDDEKWSRQSQAFSSRAAEVCDYLINHPELDKLRFKPLNRRVAVHTPCSLRNMLKRDGSLFSLLERIGQLEAVPLSTNHLCCGAAGTFMLEQPELSNALRQVKLEDIQSLKPDLVVSSNIGCLLHLQAGLSETGSNLRIIHPIVLLAEQLA